MIPIVPGLSSPENESRRSRTGRMSTGRQPVSFDRVTSGHLATSCNGVAYNSYMISGHDNDVLVPQPADAAIAIAPPAAGQGFWAGGPSAVAADDGFYLAYRLRRPIGSGRGYAVAIAYSADGVRFGDPIAMIAKEEMNTESLERPELVQLPDGGWRIFLSCATTGTKHWRAAEGG